MNWNVIRSYFFDTEMGSIRSLVRLNHWISLALHFRSSTKIEEIHRILQYLVKQVNRYFPLDSVS
jgi:hypothetical protein